MKYTQVGQVIVDAGCHRRNDARLIRAAFLSCGATLRIIATRVGAVICHGTMEEAIAVVRNQRCCQLSGWCNQ